MGTGWAFRAAGIYAWAAAVTYLALAASWWSRGDDVGVGAIVSRALVWISWSGGVAAWVTARHVEADEARLGLDELAALRGASPRAFAGARITATMALVARVVGLPSIALTASILLLARSIAAGGAAAITLFAGAIVYSLLFGVTFGGLARLSSHLSPRHGRVLFVALALGPEVLRGVIGDVPSLVSGFGELIDLVTSSGGTAA